MYYNLLRPAPEELPSGHLTKRPRREPEELWEARGFRARDGKFTGFRAEASSLGTALACLKSGRAMQGL